MRPLARRATIELMRAVVGAVMFAAILGLHLILGQLSGPIGEPFDRLIIWGLLSGIAFAVTRMIWLAVTDRALTSGSDMIRSRMIEDD
jgi:hypothetical protein